MEHRKFKKRVNELIDELTAAQAQKLIEALRERGDGDEVQNVNAYVSRFKAWLKPFNGVATKYLPSDLGWRRMLEKSGVSLTPNSCLDAVIG